MMAVATQYAAWLSTAAIHAEKAAGQAIGVAASFETTLAAAVQPAVVAANRGLAQVLAATNWLGQNAPAIADIEAAYEQMWAMDVAAMAGYHAEASELLSQLPSWDQVLQTLNIDNVGFANLGQGNLGFGNSGDHNVGFGNLGSGNIGFGNTGDGNIGFGLTGDHKIGIGIGLFNGNVGFGNAGKGNIGFGNSGTGNIGFFNSGTGNVGIFNSGALNTGLGNMGSSNLGFWNAGFGQTGFMNQSTQAINSFFGSDNVTGALSAANLNRPMFDPANLVTGGYTPDLASAALVNSGLAGAPLSAAAAAAPIGGFPPVTPGLPLSSAASAAGSVAPSVAAPATAAIGGAAPAPVRNTNAGDNPRNEPGGRTSVRDAEGIPSSGFFDKLTATRVGAGIREPGSTD